MEFWLKQGDEELQLPVKPTEFSVNVSHHNTVVNVLQLGDINLMGKTGLRGISLSSFFPAKAYNFSINTKHKTPIYIVEMIDSWRTSGEPVRVIITDLLNMEATIESFTWGQRDATGDIYYTLALKEYKKIKTKQATITIKEVIVVKETTRETKAPESSSGNTHIVQRGENLWDIAKRYYGDGSQYNKIYNANKDKIKDPNRIYAGLVLTIP